MVISRKLHKENSEVSNQTKNNDDLKYVDEIYLGSLINNSVFIIQIYL